MKLTIDLQCFPWIFDSQFRAVPLSLQPFGPAFSTPPQSAGIGEIEGQYQFFSSSGNITVKRRISWNNPSVDE